MFPVTSIGGGIAPAFSAPPDTVGAVDTVVTPSTPS